MSELQAPYNLGLTKESSEEQVRTYFKRVFHLYSSNEKFPVDLNDVWPLVYSEKSKAVRELRHSFREGEDYIPLAKLGQRTMDGRFAGGGTTYRLSVLCMEYLIVKKVPIVFNVYREVFKQVATGEVQLMPKPQSSAELLLMCAQQMVEQERKVKQIAERQEDLSRRLANVEERTVTMLPYTTIVGYANRYGIRMPIEKASTLGRCASTLCRNRGFERGKIEDPRFGEVYTYPYEVLREVFQSFYKDINFR